MSYNALTNDLPVPPSGFNDWRDVYAQTRKHLKDLESEQELSQRLISFVRSPGDMRIGPDDEMIFELPYWKIAHYAAREQVEYNEKYPPLTYEQLRWVQQAVHVNGWGGKQMVVKVDAWVEEQLNLARKRRL